MRILVTSIVDLNKSAHNRVHEFIKYLKRNHDITLLSINDWWKADQSNIELYGRSTESILSGVNIEYFTQKKLSPIYQEISSIANLSKMLRKINYQQFDVHFNYNSLLSGYYVARKMNSVGIKTVYDIADDLPAMVHDSPQIPAPLRFVGGILAKIVLRKNIALAKRITVISQSIINSLSLLTSKTVVVPNGVDIELFNNSSSAELKRELGLDQCFTLGYVGVLREWVDLNPVFAVLKELSNEKLNIKVLIVGGEGGFARNKAIAKSYGVSDKVIFTGTVPYTQVPQYICCMDLCLLPFKNNAISQNALPLKLFEYMACEKPIVSTKLEGIMKVAQGRVFYTSNIVELKQKIIKLYENEELRIKMGLEGRRFVQENYSWSQICSQVEAVLLEVASTKNE